MPSSGRVGRKNSLTVEAESMPLDTCPAELMCFKRAKKNRRKRDETNRGSGEGVVEGKDNLAEKCTLQFHPKKEKLLNALIRIMSTHTPRGIGTFIWIAFDELDLISPWLEVSVPTICNGEQLFSHFRG